MSLISHIHLVSAIVYLALGAFIIVQNPRSMLNRTAAMLFAAIFVWSLGNVVIHDPLSSHDAAVLAARLTCPGWLSFGGLYVTFILAFMRVPRRVGWWLHPLLFLPPAFFVLKQWAEPLIVLSGPYWYGWAVSWSNSIWVRAFFAYYGLSMLIGIGLVVRLVARTPDRLSRKQGLIILFCTIASLTIGTLSNVVAPLAGLRRVPDVADVGVLIFAMGTVYAIGRYRIFRLSTSVAAEQIVETMRDMFLLIDPSGVIVSANRAVLDLLDYDEAELIGRRLTDVVAPGERNARHAESVMRGEPIRNVELDLARKDGRLIPVMLSTSVLSAEGATGGIVCVARDISQHKITEADLRAEVSARTLQLTQANRSLQREIEEHRAAEDELRSSQQRLKIAFENAPDAMYVNDMLGTFVDGNRKAEETIGCPRNELIGKSFLKLKLLPASQIVHAAKLLALNIAGKSTGPDEFSLHRKDGSEILVEIHTHPVTIDGKRLVLGIARDITERRTLQDQLRQAQKMEAIGQLAGGIAHDFNNMLGAIAGYADLLLDEFKDTQPRAVRYAGMIVQSAKRAADLTAKLLTFARKGTFDAAPVDLHEAIGEVIQLLERTLGKNIRIPQRLQARRPVTVGDRTQIQNALLNLALNARDAMPDGGELSFTTEIVDVDGARRLPHASSVEPGRYVRVTIADTGIGMDEATKARLFEPFFTTKERGKGTGLGLASVYGTVKRHNGMIEITSQLGKGTAVDIYLRQTEDARPAPAEESRLHRRGSGAVLVVDDEEAMRSLCTDALSGLGYSVVTCADGVEATAYYQAHAGEVDLVILDKVMPNLGGLDCFRALKAVNPHVRALFTSGYLVDDDAAVIMGEGAAGIVRKPFDTKALAAAVAEAIGSTQR